MGDKLGVLPDIDLHQLFKDGAISSSSELDDDQIQPASLDLRLGREVYRIRASFLPRHARTVADMLREPGLQMYQADLTEQGTVLETGCVYLVPLQERLSLPAGVSGRANPKSSTGRIDVFTRVVTDKGRAFDDVPEGYSGPLYLEISPRTFSILARPGDRLAQLRLRHGKASNIAEKTVNRSGHMADVSCLIRKSFTFWPRRKRSKCQLGKQPKWPRLRQSLASSVPIMLVSSIQGLAQMKVVAAQCLKCAHAMCRLFLSMVSPSPSLSMNRCRFSSIDGSSTRDVSA